MTRLRLPSEIVASLLAITTLLFGVVAFNLPAWALFVGWAGTFAAGGPTAAVTRRLWITMPVGATTALFIVLGFQEASALFTGTANFVADAAILFTFNTAQLYLARLPMFAFPPGMFFGFASYFAMFFGGFGPSAHNPFAAWIACLLMNALGPIYAYLNVKLSAPHRAPEAPLPHGMVESVHA
jgi:Protein of unknown function (DUF1097)